MFPFQRYVDGKMKNILIQILEQKVVTEDMIYNFGIIGSSVSIKIIALLKAGLKAGLMAGAKS